MLGDLSTACEVFGLARRKDGRTAYQVRVCSESVHVESMHVALRVPWRLSSLAQADTVMVPGINDVNRPVPASVLRAIRRAAERGARVASICTGAFERHHRKPRDRRRDVGAQVATNHVDTQILLRRGSSPVRHRS